MLKSIRMDKDDYLKKLESAILNAGYSVHYATLCTRYATRLIDNQLPVIFDIRHLSKQIGVPAQNLLSMVFANELYYKTAHIPKKMGGIRELSIPSIDLKYIQRWILVNILSHVPVSRHSFAFQSNLSIVDNAKMHLHKHCVLNIDIKDFFPSISFERVFRIFAYYGYTKEVSFVLAKLCTYKGSLPQGSPASPCISNICCLKLDARIKALAEKYEAQYSRYADDMTFSGQHDLRSMIKPLKVIVQDEGFIINEKKTRLAYDYQRQEVTGLIVNGNKVSIPRQYKKTLLQELYYCKKYGVEDHLQKIECNKAFYKEHIYGKIFYINMVEPETAKRFFRLADEIEWDY